MLDVKIKLLDPDLPMPTFAHSDDAGLDLMTTEDFTLYPGEIHLVPTGIAIALPEGYAAFVHPRSGLALKKKITTLNSPGTIDAGYRGQIHVILYHAGKVGIFPDPVQYFYRGDKIAQLVFQQVLQPTFHVVDELDDTIRGANGFGSTG